MTKVSKLVENLDTRAVGILLAIFVGVALLWGTVIVAPLKIFVVLLHEISHGLAAVATGGAIDHIEINAQQGGLCVTRGGSRFLTLSAGYLGSMLWGGVILLLSSRTRLDRHLSVGIGIFLAVVTVLYVRSTFGFIFAIAFAAGMIAMGLKLSLRVNELALKVIGITSCLYAVLDILDDVLRRPGIGSDADMLADYSGIPAVVWGVIWIAIAVLASGWFLLVSAQRGGSKKAA
jgi:hypothetical protein